MCEFILPMLFCISYKDTKMKANHNSPGWQVTAKMTVSNGSKIHKFQEINRAGKERLYCHLSKLNTNKEDERI